MSSTNPWSWRPSRSGWYHRAARLAAAWKPDPALAANTPALRRRLCDAAEAEAPWLLHPCANTLTLRREGSSLQRDFQLAVWCAANSDEDLGSIRVSVPLWAWAPDGGTPVEPGTYALAELGAAVAQGVAPTAITLDVWCHSLGFSQQGSWAAQQDVPAEQERRLESEITRFFRAMCVAETALAELGSWASSVTRVVVPLCSDGGNIFRSGSSEDLPGVIHLDLFDEVQILEAIAHESAHRHLYLAEAEGPLVDPDHQGRYRSPLRPEPRPLRGILMAYHALAYICAFYADALRAGLVTLAQVGDDARDLHAKLDDAEATLAANRAFLTPRGADFLDRTVAVGNYARA